MTLPGPPTATIIIPTLDFDRGAYLMRGAQATAGVPTAAALVADGARRGSTICGNAAMASAMALQTPFVAYLNDDLGLMSPGWLRAMIDELNLRSTYGIAVPGGPCRTPPQSTAKPPPNMMERPWMGSEAHPAGHQVVKEISMFCAVIKRELLHDLGTFWHGAFIHYGNDSDFRARAQAAGWQCIWVRHVYVEHDLGAYIDEWKECDREAYRRRWGK